MDYRDTRAYILDPCIQEFFITNVTVLHWWCYLWQTAKMWKSIPEITMADIESLEVLGAHIDLVATHPQFFTIKKFFGNVLP